MDLQLKSWRRHRVLSQADLAGLAGLSKPTIVALEKPGHRTPHPRTVRRLAKALGTEPTALYADPADTKESPA